MRKTREQQVKEYYNNPNYCKQCGHIIKVIEEMSLCYTKVKQFCNTSCSAKYGNKMRPSGHISRPRQPDEVLRICLQCGKEFAATRNKRRVLSKSNFCSYQCRGLFGMSKVLKAKSKGEDALLPVHDGMTKGELKIRFPKSKWWASLITQRARKEFLLNHPDATCELCDYINSVQVCHIKSVSEFSDDATLAEINHRGNLIGLCPNHHWDLDHGMLSVIQNGPIV